MFLDNRGARYCGCLKCIRVCLTTLCNEKCKGFRRVSSKYFANYTPYDTSLFNKGTVIHFRVPVFSSFFFRVYFFLVLFLLSQHYVCFQLTERTVECIVNKRYSKLIKQFLHRVLCCTVLFTRLSTPTQTARFFFLEKRKKEEEKRVTNNEDLTNALLYNFCSTSNGFCDI